MSNTKNAILSANNFDQLVFCFSNNKPEILYQKPEKISLVMWRNVAGRAISLNLKKPFSHAYSFLGFQQESIFREKFQFGGLDVIHEGIQELGSSRIGEIFSHEDYVVRPIFGGLRKENWYNGLCPRGYASVAEAVSSIEVEEDVSLVEEIQELLQEMRKEEQKDGEDSQGKREIIHRGMGSGKDHMLKRRQVKMETEAWERAANEYRELLMDMCEQKLAPNLPYMKSLFLGWFEPMRDAIVQEQERSRMAKYKTAYAPYFDQMPADKMAVITMHKLMGLLMTGGDHGRARVVQAACYVGDAIEQEIRIHKFLEKTKMKKLDKNNEDKGGESDAIITEQEKLRKKVTNLIKKQKLPAVRQIVRGQDDFKPWGQEVKAKVGSRLIELLMQTAYIQAPTDQLADAPPDIRPAFVHTFRTVSKENKSQSKKYGVIECDPLILKGLERTARHMVIPYMPMLVPPVKWTGAEGLIHL